MEPRAPAQETGMPRVFFLVTAAPAAQTITDPRAPLIATTQLPAAEMERAVLTELRATVLLDLPEAAASTATL